MYGKQLFCQIMQFSLYLLVYWSQTLPLYVCGCYVPLCRSLSMLCTIVHIYTTRTYLYKQIKSESMCCICNIFNNSIIIIYLFVQTAIKHRDCNGAPVLCLILRDVEIVDALCNANFKLSVFMLVLWCECSVPLHE